MSLATGVVFGYLFRRLEEIQIHLPVRLPGSSLLSSVETSYGRRVE